MWQRMCACTVCVGAYMWVCVVSPSLAGVSVECQCSVCVLLPGLFTAAGTTKSCLEPINQDWLMVAPLPGHDGGSVTDVRITAEDGIRVHYAYSFGFQLRSKLVSPTCSLSVFLYSIWDPLCPMQVHRPRPAPRVSLGAFLSELVWFHGRLRV